MTGEPPPTERSVSFAIADVDPEHFEMLIAGSTPPQDRVRLRIEALDPIACPSPWRHPIAWLRWNPLLRRRVTQTINDAVIESTGDGSYTVALFGEFYIGEVPAEIPILDSEPGQRP